MLRNAARQADAHGDERTAISILRAGLARHPDAPASDTIPVLLFLSELLVRTGDVAAARIEAATVRARSGDPDHLEILDQLDLRSR